MRVIGSLLVAAMAIQLTCISCTIDSERTVKDGFSQVTDVSVLADKPAIAPIPPKNNDKFYVNIELMVFKSEVEKYPKTWENILKAIDEWKSLIPVRFFIVVMDPTTEPAFLSSTRGAVTVHLGDLQGEPYGFSKRILGMWYAPRLELFFDADALEDDPDRTYSVALHELGHMFGVPHVINAFEIGESGSIVLPGGADATKSIMYPRSGKNNIQGVLSGIEIMLARFNLIHHWTRPGKNHSVIDSCSLFPLDKGD